MGQGAGLPQPKNLTRSRTDNQILNLEPGRERPRKRGYFFV